MENKIRKFTNTGRPIDFRFRTNKAIVIITLLALFGITAFQLFTGNKVIESLRQGGWIALSVFITWAISREVDPQYDLSAFVAVVLVAIPLMLGFTSNLLILFWVILLLRVVNRTTGLPANMADSIILFLLTAWLSYQVNVVFSVFSLIAFSLDALLYEANPRQLFFAAGCLLTFLFTSLYNDTSAISLISNSADFYISLILSVLFIPVIFLQRKLSVVGDDTGIALNDRRVRLTCWLTLILALFLSWFTPSGFKSVLPIWAAITGAAIYRYFFLIKSAFLKGET